MHLLLSLHSQYMLKNYDGHEILIAISKEEEDTCCCIDILPSNPCRDSYPVISQPNPPSPPKSYIAYNGMDDNNKKASAVFLIEFDVNDGVEGTFIELTNLPSGANPINIGVINKLNNTIEKKCDSTDSDCDDASDTKFVSLGGEGTDELLRIDNDGISQGGSTGKSLVKYVGDELHIGENSWITKEEGGRQKVYAKDAAGNPIPIDYTNGTKLLINGRDVEQSINNVGALSAALTGLPTVPNDTTLACGFGTGTHGGDFAFAGGCASKVNETLSVNYAASMTMPGQDYAGDFEDTFSARAGFVWKLGKPVKPTLISMKEKKEFETQINTLEETNKQLLARLEKLEKVALGSIQSKDLASNKINFKSLNRELKKNDF